ncbi:MAG: DUF2905 domain-containing protein [Bacteroidetes bacterium]|nr:DUF2905 domain-containing protein [Bacteroidota bacterium]MDA1119268.1 DUF2905 domain-containing protein [Bacteroidota bacterium]
MVLIVLGLILTLSNKFPGIGRLPGDIVIRKENFTFYFPIVTSILLSLLLTLVFYLINKIK